MIEHDRIPLDRLLKSAQDQGKTVSVTMSNGKVYVGFVTHLFNPGFPTTYIEILPVKSGYRRNDIKTVKFTTFYSNALHQIERDFDEKSKRLFEVENKLGLLKSNDKPDETEIANLESERIGLQVELEAAANIADDFGIVLPVHEIHSVNIFSEHIHTEYFAPGEGERDDPPLLVNPS